jgi:hypothetical protein
VDFNKLKFAYYNEASKKYHWSMFKIKDYRDNARFVDVNVYFVNLNG